MRAVPFSCEKRSRTSPTPWESVASRSTTISTPKRTADMLSASPSLTVAFPAWMSEVCQPGARFATVDERMALVIELARTSVARQTGGPFGAAVFDIETGEVIAPGVNLVVSAHAALAHAEMLAI